VHLLELILATLSNLTPRLLGWDAHTESVHPYSTVLELYSLDECVAKANQAPISRINQAELSPSSRSCSDDLCLETAAPRESMPGWGGDCRCAESVCSTRRCARRSSCRMRSLGCGGERHDHHIVLRSTGKRAMGGWGRESTSLALGLRPLLLVPPGASRAGCTSGGGEGERERDRRWLMNLRALLPAPSQHSGCRISFTVFVV
jgi:hypothetical protein